MTTLDEWCDELDAELRAMTSKELRQYAREHHITLGYAGGRKADMKREIVGQMRHREFERRLVEKARVVLDGR